MSQQVAAWAWQRESGAEQLRQAIDADGFALFHDPTAIEQAADPLAFGQALFGQRPIRFQKMIIQNDPAGNQKTLPKTMFAGALHNDCAQLGVPPHVQVMVCERQAPVGGGSLILDLWPVLDHIRDADPDLLRALFTVPRVFPSGHLPRYGLTWSLCRGNLVCVHPTRARSDAIGLAFQRHIDAAEPVAFKCAPGDVYINNNHRCLHGRQAFHDPSRRFTRFLFWFARPMPAPAPLLERDAAGTQALASRLADEPRWAQQLMGVDAPQHSPRVTERAARLIEQLAQPTHCDEWQGPGQRDLLLQEALLSALWPILAEPPTDGDRMHRHLQTLVNTAVLQDLGQCPVS
jgi:gamma-butyrobetaine dioxygenase